MAGWFSELEVVNRDLMAATNLLFPDNILLELGSMSAPLTDLQSFFNRDPKSQTGGRSRLS